MHHAYSQTRIDRSRANAAARRASYRSRNPAATGSDGICPLCQHAWDRHAMPERRAHRRLVAAGATELPDDEADEPCP